MNKLNTPFKTTLAGAALAMSMGVATMAQAGADSDYSGKVRDAWLDGKIETAFALNKHLNPFAIDTKVEDGMVYLEGTVESEIDRDLAGQIALGVEGVSDVENRLKVAEVEPSAIEKASGEFMQHVSDATTTAVVKSKLVANKNTSGLKINVDTNDNVVTLRGTVESDEVRDLAEAHACSGRYLNNVP